MRDLSASHPKLSNDVVVGGLPLRQHPKVSQMAFSEPYHLPFWGQCFIHCVHAAERQEPVARHQRPMPTPKARAHIDAPIAEAFLKLPVLRVFISGSIVETHLTTTVERGFAKPQDIVKSSRGSFLQRYGFSKFRNLATRVQSSYCLMLSSASSALSRERLDTLESLLEALVRVLHARERVPPALERVLQRASCTGWSDSTALSTASTTLLRALSRAPASFLGSFTTLSRVSWTFPAKSRTFSRVGVPSDSFSFCYPGWLLGAQILPTQVNMLVLHSSSHAM